MTKIGVIGGSGVYSLDDIKNPKRKVVQTEYGNSPEVVMGKVDKREVVFMPRHGKEHSEPPHKINFKANISAFDKLDVDRIIATNAVGSLNPDFSPGDFVVIDQFLDFTKNRDTTFYDGEDDEVMHVDMTEPYCSELRHILIEKSEELGFTAHSEGTYACTEGPRFETAAEIQMLNKLGGDVVGMTNVPECVFARELEICYSAVSVITNYGAGIGDEKLTHSEVKEIMDENIKKVKDLVFSVISQIPDKRACECNNALDGARVEP